MHDRVRKTCCRLLFLLGVASPTLLMLSWAIARNTPQVAEQTKLRWQQQLGVKLGFEVTLAAVETPRPGLVVLRSVRLSDAETGLNCGEIGTIRLWRAAGKQVVLLEDPQIRIAEASETWRWFVQHLLRQTDSREILLSTAPVDFEALPGEMKTRFTGIEFACHLRSENELTTLTINMQNPRTESVPIALQLQRQHLGTVSTRITLDTATTPLPCYLLVPLFPQMAVLGADAHFRGQLSAEQGSTGKVLDVAGKFSGVDLQRWLGPICAEALTGSAQLHLQRARIINDACVHATGSLIAENGMVKRSLLQQASRELGLQWVYDLGAEQGTYERLSCYFNLDKNGIELSGESEGRFAGAILRHPRGVLLAAAETPQRVSSQSLARSLGSPSVSGVPLSRSALRLLQGAGRQSVLQAQSPRRPDSVRQR